MKGNPVRMSPLPSAPALVVDMLRDVLGPDVFIEPKQDTLNGVDAVVAAKLAPSKTAARQLLKSNAIRCNGGQLVTENSEFGLGHGMFVTAFLLSRGRERRVLAWVDEEIRNPRPPNDALLGAASRYATDEEAKAAGTRVIAERRGMLEALAKR